MMSVEERYERDPIFRQLVEAIYELLVHCQTTPTEVREAVMLAQVRFEREHPRMLRPLSYNEFPAWVKDRKL